MRQAQKNEVAIAVRGYNTGALYDSGPDAMMPSVDIPKLNECIMTRATRQQHAMVWSKSSERPELENKSKYDDREQDINGEQDGVEAKPMDIDSHPNPDAQQPRRTLSGMDASAALPSATTSGLAKMPMPWRLRAKHEPERSTECASGFTLMGPRHAGAHDSNQPSMHIHSSSKQHQPVWQWESITLWLGQSQRQLMQELGW
ncbi:hypothetical protein PENSPDRAFT_672293 [Peniophora sp. CONT]|nr:hypothetical protein PENSPDRAFT_672293 [Peniophora sp. CONT]